MHWTDSAAAAHLRSQAMLDAGPNEGIVVQGLDGSILGANERALALLRYSWSQLTGVTSNDPRWAACGDDGRLLTGDEHPAMVTLRTHQPVRGFVMGVEAPTADGVGEFVWLVIDSDPIVVDFAIAGVCARFRDVSSTEVGLNATRRVIRTLREFAMAAANSESRYRAVVQSSGDVVCELDLNGRIVSASPAITEWLGWLPHQVMGRDLIDLLHPRDRQNVDAEARVLGTAFPREGRSEYRYATASRGWRWMSSVSRLVYDSAGEPYEMLTSLRDAQEEVERRERLAHEAAHDSLTGLINRDSAFTFLADVLADPGQDLVAALYIDVDNFKFVNDSKGHPYGDSLLVEVANRLSAVVRPTDRVARIGGDEFLVILTRLPDERAVARRAQDLIESVRAGRLDTVVTISVGMAADGRSESAEELVARADVGLLRAKKDGRDRASW